MEPDEIRELAEGWESRGSPLHKRIGVERSVVQAWIDGHRLPRVRGRQLEFLARGLRGVKAVEASGLPECAVMKGLDDRAIREHALHLPLEILPLVRAVEVVEHRRAAPQQEFAQTRDFGLRQLQRAGLDDVDPGMLEELRIVEDTHEALTLLAPQVLTCAERQVFRPQPYG